MGPPFSREEEFTRKDYVGRNDRDRREGRRQDDERVEGKSVS